MPQPDLKKAQGVQLEKSTTGSPHRTLPITPIEGKTYPYRMAPTRPKGWTAYYFPDGVVFHHTRFQDHLPWVERLLTPGRCQWCGAHSWDPDFAKLHCREMRERYPLPVEEYMAWRRGYRPGLVCMSMVVLREHLQSMNAS